MEIRKLSDFQLNCFDEVFKKLTDNEIIIKSLRNENLTEKMSTILDYINIGKEQFMIGNKIRSYRIYVVLSALVSRLT